MQPTVWQVVRKATGEGRMSEDLGLEPEAVIREAADQSHAHMRRVTRAMVGSQYYLWMKPNKAGKTFVSREASNQLHKHGFFLNYAGKFPLSFYKPDTHPVETHA